MNQNLSRSLAILACSTVLAACGAPDPAETMSAQSEQGIKPGNPAPSGSVYVPMTVTSEVLQKRWSATDPTCFAVDDQYHWTVAGSLHPGESYTFQAVRTCDFAEMPAIAVKASWDASDLEVSSIAPANDGISSDTGQSGTPVVAASHGREAHLCMFTNAYGTGEGYSYSVTIRNKGEQTAFDVRLEGQQTNGWLIYYHNACVRADADGDGWNDSLEHGMQHLLYYTSYSNPSAKGAELDGTNYLRVAAASSLPDDEVDTYPPDVNDDGVVDQADVDRVASFEGQGTGVSMDMIDSNPGPRFIYNQTGVWRRYDLDGDGWVDSRDSDTVRTLLATPIPTAEDILPPSVRLRSPAGLTSVPRASDWLLEAFASDNRWIDRVDFFVNGSPVCSSSGGTVTYAKTSQFSCWWHVPRKTGAYVVSARTYDAAGNSATDSATVTVH